MTKPEVSLTTRKTPRTFGATCRDCGQCFTPDTSPDRPWPKAKAAHERGTHHTIDYLNWAEEKQ